MLILLRSQRRFVTGFSVHAVGQSDLGKRKTKLPRHGRGVLCPYAYGHQCRARDGEMGSGLSLHGSILSSGMSALGQKQTFSEVCAMSALPPKADIGTQQGDVRFVPKADS